MIAMQSKQPPRVDLFGRELPDEAAPAQPPQTPSVSTPPATALPALGEVEPHPSLRGGFNMMSERKLSMIIPAGSYHFTHKGDHYRMPNGQALNETRNFGLGRAVQTSENTEAFVVGYRNSYADTRKYRNDVTVMAGVNWDPLKVDMGPLHLKAGLMAGVATTLKGSYADMAPKASKGDFTAMGGLHAEVTHRESGIGIGATLLPPSRQSLGVASFYLKKEL